MQVLIRKALEGWLPFLRGRKRIDEVSSRHDYVEGDTQNSHTPDLPLRASHTQTKLNRGRRSGRSHQSCSPSHNFNVYSPHFQHPLRYFIKPFSAAAAALCHSRWLFFAGKFFYYYFFTSVDKIFIRATHKSAASIAPNHYATTHTHKSPQPIVIFSFSPDAHTPRVYHSHKIIFLISCLVWLSLPGTPGRGRGKQVSFSNPSSPSSVMRFLARPPPG